LQNERSLFDVDIDTGYKGQGNKGLVKLIFHSHGFTSKIP